MIDVHAQSHIANIDVSPLAAPHTMRIGPDGLIHVSGRDCGSGRRIRHLEGENTLILHDVSSSYLEGRRCRLAAFGHSRDGKRGKRQIVFGLLCAADGCPVAVEVFPGNAGDPSTVASQVDKVRKRFGIGRVALVGDRGMLTTARIREDLEPAGLDWISALKTSDIRKLLREGADGAPAPLVPEALVPDAVAEVTGPDFPGERLMVCLNPRLREERARKREDLLKATEEALEAIAASVRSGRLKGREAIDRRVGRDANRRKVGKHFEIDVTDGGI
ncbi:MAG: transposase, partial [Boseongicola sp. SB0677_bin_26]|nr:transposase [Boseongicola sp. SB0677_bin_26]